MSTSPSPIALIGIPLDLGAENLGVDIGPKAFRYTQLVNKLHTAGLDVTDHGDIACPDRHSAKVGDPKQRHLAEIVAVSEATAAKVEGFIRGGRRVVGLGGDHSVTLGLVAGASAATDGDIGLIYFDAHGDMNTAETTLSGNIHGMHLASLMGFGGRELIDAYKPGAKLTKENLLHIGGSDFDEAELDLIKREGISAFTLHDLLSGSLAPLWPQIDALAKRVKHIWISFDLDVLNEQYAPGAGMPNQAGLSYREIAAIATYIGRTCPVIGVDIVEYNPLLDINSRTAELSAELIAKFFGTDYSWYTAYLAKNQRA
jgi:arginase